MSRQVNVPTAPVQVKIVVPGDPDRAYELFTESFSEWWPLETHGAFAPDAASCHFEAREGGRIYERAKDGREAEWGRVLELTPHESVRFTWHPGRDAETAQEVTVSFRKMMFGTTLELAHGNWEPLGEKARETRSSYERDWPGVLQKFADRAGKTS